MKSECHLLLDAIQQEVAHYVFNNFWLDRNGDCEKYCTRMKDDDKPLMFVGCILHTKKLDDNRHLMFPYQVLAEHTFLSEKQLLEKPVFHYVTSVNENPGRNSVMVTLNIEKVTTAILRMRVGEKPSKETKNNKPRQKQGQQHFSIVLYNDSFTGKDIGDVRGYCLSTVAQKILSRTGRKVSTFLFGKGELREVIREMKIQKNHDTLASHFESLKIQAPPPSCNQKEDNDLIPPSIYDCLGNCKYCERELNCKDIKKSCWVDVNLKKYIDEELKRKDNFLNDINKIKAIEDGVVTDYIKNAQLINTSKISDLALHIMPSRTQYKLKSITLLSHLLFPERFTSQIISTYEYGCLNVQQDSVEGGNGGCGVSSGNGSAGESDFQSWLQLRRSELWTSYSARYGSDIQGPCWERVIDKLAEGSLKLDIYSTSLNKKVRFGVTTDENFTSQKSMFILYNYARLCKITENFEDHVKKGLYEPLSDPESLDLSVLKEDMEWGLVMRYILKYHIFMDEFESFLTDCSVIDRATIPAEKLYFFLSDLCRDLSKYYKQTKVLLDPQPHLIPLLHARVHLISIIKEVMEDCFDILGIEAPNQM